MHYHHGMRAGENTLNAVVARLLVRTMTTEKGACRPSSFLDAYVKFMTTPGSHNDSYAETFHRMFFKNFAEGVPPDSCAEDDGHNIASVGGLVLIPPVALAAAAGAAGAAAAATCGASVLADACPAPLPQLSDAGLAAVEEAAVAQQHTTHNSRALERYTRLYSNLLARLLAGAPARPAIAATARAVGFDVAKLVAAVEARGGDDKLVVGGKFGLACYIEDSFPNILYLAYKYAEDPIAGLLSNTNCGGENAHRGAALGAILGVANGERCVRACARAGVPAARACPRPCVRPCVVARGRACAWACA